MAVSSVMKDVPIKELKLNPDNPRKNEEAVVEVMKSIKDGGYITPIVVDENNSILAGNTRYKALVSLGWTVVPFVMKVEGLTDKQKQRFILADNKTQEFAEWDWEKLAAFAEEVLADVGFSDTEIDKILNPKDQDKGVIPDVRENVDIKEGDVFQIGPHRLVCGDSRKQEIYTKLMDGKTAEMVFTDPPYNVAYEGSMNTYGQNKRKGIKNDDMSEADFLKFLEDSLAPMMAACDGCFYICMSSKELTSLKQAFEKMGGHWQSFIMWVKNTFTLSRADWQNQYEPILYGWNGKNKDHYFAGWRNEGNVWEGLDVIHPVYDGQKTRIHIGDYHLELDGIVTGKIISKRGETDIWNEKKPSKNKFHPTEKPLGLIAKAIQASSHRDSIILDPFAGSGTTMIASQENSRVCYSIEMEPQYCDVILRRMHMTYPALLIMCNNSAYDLKKLEG